VALGFAVNAVRIRRTQKSRLDHAFPSGYLRGSLNADGEPFQKEAEYETPKKP